MLEVARLMVVAALISVLSSLLVGWLVMLAMGVLHHELSASVPPVGYWPLVLICLAAGAVIRFVAQAVRR
jgi:hypothetical protein